MAGDQRQQSLPPRDGSDPTNTTFSFVPFDFMKSSRPAGQAPNQLEQQINHRLGSLLGHSVVNKHQMQNSQLPVQHARVNMDAEGPVGRNTAPQSLPPPAATTAALDSAALLSIPNPAPLPPASEEQQPKEGSMNSSLNRQQQQQQQSHQTGNDPSERSEPSPPTNPEQHNPPLSTAPSDGTVTVNLRKDPSKVPDEENPPTNSEEPSQLEAALAEAVGGPATRSGATRLPSGRQFPIKSSKANPGSSLDGKFTSAFRGVTRHRQTGRFEAHFWDSTFLREPKFDAGGRQIGRVKGRQVYIGGYDTEEAAARSYDKAALAYLGSQATTNYPKTDYSTFIKELDDKEPSEVIAQLRRNSLSFARGRSRFRGVTKHHYNGKWESRIGRARNGKYLYLGVFDSAEEAAIAYDKALVKVRGKLGMTNFAISNYTDILNDPDSYDVEAEAKKNGGGYTNSNRGGAEPEENNSGRSRPKRRAMKGRKRKRYVDDDDTDDTDTDSDDEDNMDAEYSISGADDNGQAGGRKEEKQEDADDNDEAAGLVAGEEGEGPDGDDIDEAVMQQNSSLQRARPSSQQQQQQQPQKSQPRSRGGSRASNKSRKLDTTNDANDPSPRESTRHDLLMSALEQQLAHQQQQQHSYQQQQAMWQQQQQHLPPPQHPQYHPSYHYTTDASAPPPPPPGAYHPSYGHPGSLPLPQHPPPPSHPSAAAAAAGHGVSAPSPPPSLHHPQPQQPQGHQPQSHQPQQPPWWQAATMANFPEVWQQWNALMQGPTHPPMSNPPPYSHPMHPNHPSYQHPSYHPQQQQQHPHQQQLPQPPPPPPSVHHHQQQQQQVYAGPSPNGMPPPHHPYPPQTYQNYQTYGSLPSPQEKPKKKKKAKSGSDEATTEEVPRQVQDPQVMAYPPQQQYHNDPPIIAPPRQNANPSFASPVRPPQGPVNGCGGAGVSPLAASLLSPLGLQAAGKWKDSPLEKILSASNHEAVVRILNSMQNNEPGANKLAEGGAVPASPAGPAGLNGQEDIWGTVQWLDSLDMAQLIAGGPRRGPQDNNNNTTTTNSAVAVAAGGGGANAATGGDHQGNRDRCN